MESQQQHDDARFTIIGLVSINGMPLVLRELCRERNLSAEDVAQAAGLGPSWLTRTTTRFGVRDMRAMLVALEAATGDDAIGAAIGQRIVPGNLRSLGFAMAASATLSSALRRFQQYHSLIGTHVTVTIERTATECWIWLNLRETGAREGDLIAEDVFAASLLSILRSISSAPVICKAVHLRRQRPDHLEAFQSLFGPGLRYHQPRTGLCLPTKVLETRLRTPDHLTAVALDHASDEQLLAAPLADVMARVVAEIRAGLAEGEVSRAAVADGLRMSERTLQRRLEEADTTFRELHERVRGELAQELVEHSDMPLLEVGYMVGFRSASNFTRAFKRWFATTPSAARQTSR